MLFSESCQALERYMLLGLCCTLEKEVSQGQGGQAQGRNAGTLGESKQLLWDMAKAMANPTLGELVSHNCMILT